MADLQETIDIRLTTIEINDREEPMTPYQERREAGYYDAPDAVAVEDAPADEDNGATLAELREQAEARDLPTYGTKAQLAERIANYDNSATEDIEL